MFDFLRVMLISVLGFLVNLIIPIFGIYFIIKCSLNFIQKNHKVLGSILCVIGVFFMIFFGYIRLAHYSKLPYSILSNFQDTFYTEANYDKDYIIKKDLNSHYRIYDKKGNYFTGTIKTYFQKLRFSPIEAEENGISYFIDGYLVGSSQNPTEPMFLGNNFGEALPEDRYNEIKIPLLIYDEYEKILKEEVATWGKYILIDKKANFNKNYKIKYAFCVKGNSLMKREIVYYKNGLVSLIRPYRLSNFNEWIFGGGNYFSFDSLGYLTIKEKWNKNGTVDYRKTKKGKWESDKFIEVNKYPDILKENEENNLEFKKKIFSSEIPDFLENFNLWKTEKNNFENLCTILNNDKFNNEIIIKLKIEKEYITLSKEKSKLFIESINSAKLITSIEEDPEIFFNEGKELEFIILNGNKKIGKLLFSNNKFYMENGIYIFLLSNDEFKNKFSK